jgi:hypothetical protein
MAIGNRSRKSSKGKEESKGAQVTARLYKRDEKQFMSIARNEFRGNEAEATRELIAEALTTRRLKSIGRDTSLSAVKEAQYEVIAGEADEIKTLLKDVLAIVRGSGTGIDRIIGQNREIYGVIFHILRTVLNVEDMSQEYLVRPALEEEGKKDEAVTEAFRDSQTGWTEQAQRLLESVRTQLSQASVQL